MKTAVLFSGQGAQHVGMGLSLYNKESIVQSIWDQADEMLGFDLKKAAFEGPDSLLTETRICQPALYVHGYAIFKMLQEKGFLGELKASLGLSLGELTALAAAEVFDFETGLKIVSARGTLMQQACSISDGAMTSLIGGTTEDAEALAKEFNVDIANLNCPGQIVLSGHKSRIEKASLAATSKGFKKAILLNVAGAYHSSLMQPAANSFATFLEQIEFKQPIVTVFSNYTGKAYSNTEEIKDSIIKQVTHSVKWEDNMKHCAELGINKFYECGPGKVLAGLAKRIEKSWTVESFSEASDLENSTI